jgi:acid phosphatase
VGGALLAQGFTFRGYAEDLPAAGALDCLYPKDQGKALYARKHCPWSDFADVPATMSQPSSQFPHSFSDLPTVAFVIPNLRNDMHNGQDPDRITRADTWLQQHLAAYVDWAKTNNSLLVLTWDEDNHHRIPPPNQIPTLLVGPMVQPGRYPARHTHYDLLRTIEEMYGLPLLGGSAGAQAIDEVWR